MTKFASAPGVYRCGMGRDQQGQQGRFGCCQLVRATAPATASASLSGWQRPAEAPDAQSKLQRDHDRESSTDQPRDSSERRFVIRGSSTQTYSHAEKEVENCRATGRQPWPSGPAHSTRSTSSDPRGKFSSSLRNFKPLTLPYPSPHRPLWLAIKPQVAAQAPGQEICPRFCFASPPVSPIPSISLSLSLVIQLTSHRLPGSLRSLTIYP